MLKTTPLARKRDIVVQELDDEILIYDLKTNKVFGLNHPSSLVWRLSTGDKTILEIARIISEQLNSPVGEEFVWLALGQLKKENLLENTAEISEDF